MTMRSDFTGLSWAQFQDNPLPGVHADYLAHSLKPLSIVHEDLFRKTIDELGERALFIELLQRHNSLAPLSGLRPLTDEDAYAAALSVQEWRMLVEICGTVYWSRVLAREVRTPVLRLLDAQLGRNWWEWVQTGLSDASDSDPLPASAVAEQPEQWAVRIRHSGSALLRAWQDTLDPGLAAWVKLKDSVGNTVLEETEPAGTIASGTRVVACVCRKLTQQARSTA